MIQNIINAIGEAIGAIITFLPLALAFIAILLIGYAVAKALQKGTDAVLERVGFDDWVERGGVRKAMERSKYDASDLLARVVYWAVILFTLQLAFGIFGPNPVSAIINDIVGYLPELFAAILIVVVGSAIAGAVREVVAAATAGLSYGRMLANGAAGAILVVTVFAALTQLGIAPLIVTGLFYALLAIVAGIAIVAVGGGGIQPMREYWQRGLKRVEEETPKIREQTQGASERVRERAEERRREVQVERSEERRPAGQKQR